MQELTAIPTFPPAGSVSADHGTILIVDDDYQVRHILSVLLKAEFPGLNVIGAATSSEALAHAAIKRPCLMIIDFHLFSSPLNGLEIFDELHRNPSRKPIPTIMLSSDLPQEEIRKRHMAAMSKPFDIDAFLERVLYMLTHAE